MSSHTARRTQLGGVVLALGVAAYLTVQLSIAAFTDTATNPDNAFTAGDVRISESHAGVAMFDIDGIVPGWSEARTVTVTNDSTVDTQVGLYVSGLTDTGLAPFLQVTVTRGGSALYSGALTGLPQSFEDATASSETPGAATVYEFTVSLPDGQTGLNDARGTDATAAFTWEARSVSS